MSWKKYQPIKSGDCDLAFDGEVAAAHYEVGLIETGRSRVFAGYYVRVTSSEGGEWLGEDARSMLGALHAAHEVAAHDRGALMCAGLDDGFYETGLSGNTGYGYIGRSDAIYMMDRLSLHSHN